MKNIYEITSRERLLDETSVWIAKLDEGLPTEKEQQLDKWLKKSPSHRKAFVEMAEMWDKMEVLSKLADLFPEPFNQDKGRLQNQRRWLSASAVAAIILLIALPVFWGGFHSPLPEEKDPTLVVSNMQGVYKTAIGEHRDLTLPDGTEIVLNTNTIVRVQYTDRQRLFFLEQGELNVDVAHDEGRPLSVFAGGKVVQAVGTAFNIELNENRQIELLVTDGKVLVEFQNAIGWAEETVDPVVMPSSSRTVLEGQRLLLGQSEKVETIAPSDIEVTLSWRTGNLIFRGETLEEAIVEISRYNAVEFVFMDENLKKQRVVGLFKSDDVTGLLKTLRENFDVSYQRLDGKILLSSL